MSSDLGIRGIRQQFGNRPQKGRDGETQFGRVEPDGAGLVTGIFCLSSLALGYAGARLLQLARPQAIATSMEVGIHNTTVALTIALSVLGSTEVAIPSAVYSVLMYVLATAFGYVVTRGGSEAFPVDAAPTPTHHVSPGQPPLRLDPQEDAMRQKRIEEAEEDPANYARLVPTVTESKVNR